ncbi:hypothetical protein niasHS_013382 [Heterodera schachtii]|uniref:Uncharacterized protein n=1 Tax=Heterodera schachtii TaxID=97005 RepID=A0ABD2I4X9_HETSC
MSIRFFYVHKFVQTAITAFALWRLLSESLICGTFVNVKEPLHHGLRGACKALFFYVDPKRQPSMGDNNHQPTHQHIRPRLRLWWFFEGSNFLPSPPTHQEIVRLVEQVKQEEELLSTDGTGTDAIKRSKSRRRRRKRSNFGDDLLADANADDGETATAASLFCYELNLQGSSSPSSSLPNEPISVQLLQQQQQSKGNPLIILANRSVVTVAVALAQFLLLFAQIYLLNCLDEDNFQQKRGKLFLELFVLILSCLSWLIVFLLSLRTEFDWEHMWLCTNFRPKLLSVVIIIQTVSAVLILMCLCEGIRVFIRMKKYDRLIERMKQRKINKYRPRG